MAENTFAEMNSKLKPQSATVGASPLVGPATLNAAPKGPREITTADFSDTAVGDKKKYNRESLDGQTVVVDRFQCFEVDTTEEPKVSQGGTSKYWEPDVIITYDHKNADGVNDREYLSGAKQFVQRAGEPSEVQFWYAGATNQCAVLWEAVAKALGLNPDQLSLRQFSAFLNSKPKAIIVGTEFKNYGAVAGAPKTVKKNMVKEFVKA